jgi:hypothetical protein
VSQLGGFEKLQDAGDKFVFQETFRNELKDSTERK